MSYWYRAFDLQLESNREIPGLLRVKAPDEEAADIRFELVGPAVERLPDSKRQLIYTSPRTGLEGRPILLAWSLRNKSWYRLCYDDGTEFVVDGHGTRVWASWPLTLTVRNIAPYITGPILGFVMRLRRVVCLHASAIALGSQRSVAFAGSVGAGKSTLAAAFASAGYPVIADDVVALNMKVGYFTVPPAHPQVRLWEPTVDALFGTDRSLPHIAPNDTYRTKQYLQLATPEYPFPEQATPLTVLYLLDGRAEPGAEPSVAAISKQEALIFLVANTYMNYLLDVQARAHEFAVLTQLVRTVPVRRLRAPHDLASLDSVLRLVVSDRAALSPTATRAD